jgi:hypothetical protein
MFGLFKSWPEKCFSAVKSISSMDDEIVQKWFLAFETEIIEMHDEGERKPEFCIAWCATCHLHKIVDTKHPNCKFLGLRCRVSTDNVLINQVSIKICEATLENMHDEMKEGVLSSLRMFYNLDG